MKGNLMIQWLVIIASFVLAFVMEIVPWAGEFQSFRPAWLVLVLLYWAMAIPTKISIGVAFILGVVWDLMLGSILGIHALILSTFIYFVSKYHLILRNLSLWQQGLLVIVFIFVIRLGIFVLETLLHSATFNWSGYWGALISGLIWPWLFLVLRKVRRQVKLH